MRVVICACALCFNFQYNGKLQIIQGVMCNVCNNLNQVSNIIFISIQLKYNDLPSTNNTKKQLLFVIVHLKSIQNQIL